MRVIYVDVLLILNFCMDFCILRAAAAMGGRRIARVRLALAAFAGACYAVLCAAVPQGSWIPFRLLAGIGMTAAAFGVRRGLLRQFLLVILVTFVFGGCVAALEQMSGTMLTVNGVLYASVSKKTLLLAAVLAYGLSGMIFRRKAAQDTAQGEQVLLTVGEKTAELYLLYDSGNTLHDPLTGRPVILLTRKAAAQVLPEELQFIALLLQENNAAELVQRAQHKSPCFRLISFHSIGGSGLLPCFHPTRTIRAGKEYDCMAAISDTDIGEGTFDGLIGL